MERRRAVVAAASNLIRLVVAVVVVGLLLAPAVARAEDAKASDIDDARILDTSEIRLQSIDWGVASFDQHGTGYQSQAGPVRGPGSESAWILENQALVVFTQGEHLTHRVWIPVDVVTAASPNSIAPPDVQSGASRQVESGSLDWTVTYRKDRAVDLSMRNSLHLEQPFRSWSSGIGMRRSFADDATVVSANLLEVFDWFDRFDIHGTHEGRTTRNSTTGAIGFTQILTPTTVANVNYGITTMEGTLGNTWNSVPLAAGGRGAELLPTTRTRHALVVRASQWLPWNGALRLYYRFYADDWGIAASSFEAQLMQRFSRQLYIGAYYRFHTQTGAYFFTTLAPADWSLRVADSDLAPLNSDTVGVRAVLDFPVSRTATVRAVHLELAVESYTRTNDLQMQVVSWATGFRF